jgi:hypothetical protein
MNAAPRHDPREDPQDVQLRQMLHRLPEPEPSHGFDARLVDVLMREASTPDRQAEPHRSAAGRGSPLLGLRRPSWQLVATASLALVIVATVVIQRWSSDSDLTRIDLITLMSHDLL